MPYVQNDYLWLPVQLCYTFFESLDDWTPDCAWFAYGRADQPHRMYLIPTEASRHHQGLLNYVPYIPGKGFELPLGVRTFTARRVLVYPYDQLLVLVFGRTIDMQTLLVQGHKRRGNYTETITSPLKAYLTGGGKEKEEHGFW